MAIRTTTDSSGKPIILGSYVRDSPYRRLGRVYGVDIIFSETSEGRRSDGGAGWLSEQVVPISNEERRGVWVSVLVDKGGSILVPASRLEVVDPFLLDNDFAAIYFGEGPDPVEVVAEREDLHRVKVLGAELRVWEPDAMQNDRGRMYVLEALGTSLLVREREDGTYVHVENEGVVREPLLVEVNNGGENVYGEEVYRESAPPGSTFETAMDRRILEEGR